MIRNMFRMFRILFTLLVIGLVACSGTGPVGDPAVDETAQALAEGDAVTRCFPGEFDPEDAPQCEAKSGVRVFQVGMCVLTVERKCKLVEVDDKLHCCCRARVVDANDFCDDVSWADLNP